MGILPIDALDAIKAEPPHVLVTGINMPNMDGLKLTSEAMKLIRDLPVSTFHQRWAIFS